MKFKFKEIVKVIDGSHKGEVGQVVYHTSYMLFKRRHVYYVYFSERPLTVELFEEQLERWNK